MTRTRLEVANVMRRELFTLAATGLRVSDVGKHNHLPHWLRSLTKNAEAKLSQTDVKGFPIVTGDERHLLLGYIGRNELRYVLGVLFFFKA